ncbi:hypothetical protein [Halorubrum sp. Boch-26]|uniref:DUF7470 family protein n=1 Tax=Halorubrum sp. Boch-26 TaxID=2994426 RepID=UPI00246877CA|nr:hypothetical protein [Halorubrum sp. Boch-26]
MRDTLGLTGLVGVALLILAVGLLTVYDPVIGGGIALLLAGLGLIAKGVADSAMRIFGLK